MDRAGVSLIIDEETYRRAREQLKVNALRAFRNLHGKHRYLLRSLVRYGACGRARTGRTTYTGGREYTYYDCTSTLVRPRVDRCCKNPGVRAEELYRLVWDEVKKLLRNPEEILRCFHEQHGKEVGTTFDLGRRKLSELERSLAILKREECRLVDAYQGQVIQLEELRERRSAIDQRRKELRADVKRVEQELGSIREGVALLTKKLAGSLEELTFEEKQKIIQLLVEEIRVHVGYVEIHYIMPLSGNLHLQSRSLDSQISERVLQGKIAIRLKKLLYDPCRMNKWWICEIAIQDEHLHVMVQVPPQCSVAEVVQIFKGGTNRISRKKYPELEESY
jgi:hypothetical protein